MTGYEIRIEELVLHGVPHALAADIGPLVEQRLADLAAGERPAQPAAQAQTAADLADGIAHAVWQRIEAGVPR